MAATRHNLSRRAVLGAGVGVCVARDGHLLTVPSVQGSAHEQGSSSSTAGWDSQQVTVPDLRRRWNRTLAAYRRAEARVTAFKAQEALLPRARRAYPACEDLEQRFGDLDDRRFAALRRLLRLPAPDLAALALKLDLAVADQAWELTGAENCLAGIAADARRLAHD
jgi:hypothetical protein